MKDKLYEDYAVLDAQVKLLQGQRDELRVEIVKDIVDSGETAVKTAVGNFTISKLKTWTYTPVVAELNDRLKARKATEESTGEASFEEKPSLRFNQIKL